MTAKLPADFDSRTRNYWPSFCDVCKASAWFPSRIDRMHWEMDQHNHGGVD